MLLQWKRARGGYYICTALWLTTCLVHWQEQTVEFIASIPFFIGPFHVIYLQVDKDHLNAPWNKWWAHTGLWWGVIVSWSRSLKWNTALTVCPSENSSGLVFLTSSKTKRYLYPHKHTTSLSLIPPSKKKTNNSMFLSFCRTSKQYPLSFNQLGVFSDAIVLQCVHSNLSVVSLSNEHRHLDKNRKPALN